MKADNLPGIANYLATKRKQINAALREVIPLGEGNGVETAARYALCVDNPPKVRPSRWRPILTLALAEEFQNPHYSAKPDSESSEYNLYGLACASEIIHTASLILDDMESMDNAKLRRGRLTTHLKYGTANAQMAVLRLQNASTTVVSKRSPPYCKDDLVVEAAETGNRMIEGQRADLSQALSTEEDVIRMYEGKTGALFALSARLGLFHEPAGWSKEVTYKFGHQVGVAYQLADDLKDTQSSEITGKDQDQDQGKMTLIAIFGGREKAIKKAMQHKEKAIKFIQSNEKLEQILDKMIVIE